MASKHKFTVPFRRKREGRTNYKKRLSMLKSRKLRLVIRPSMKHMTVQLVSYAPDGDKVLAGVHSSRLRKLGWKLSCGNLPSAYLSGYLLGKQAMKQNPGQVIVDTGLLPIVRASRLFAVAKGVKDAGIDIFVDESMLPPDDRLQGAHIAAYLKQGGEGHQFSGYKKKQISTDIPALVGEIKKKIDAL
ncbi:MAG: 50S ribosomal protein L18 [DPANN group archaeon]|nr:50S ribosomal protein L18 [DPANN group archaeon]